MKDDKTKKVYDIKNMDGQTVTTTLFKILKDRTQCNLIGFYFFSGTVASLFYTINDISVLKRGDEWKNTGFISLSSSGYDEYFIINSNEITEEYDSFGTGGTSKNKIDNIFSKMCSSKKMSRKLLDNFIQRVSKNTF